MSFIKQTFNSSKLPSTEGSVDHDVSSSSGSPAITFHQSSSEKENSNTHKQSPMKRVASPLLNAFRRDSHKDNKTKDGTESLQPGVGSPPHVGVGFLPSPIMAMAIGKTSSLSSRPSTRPSSPLHPGSPTLSERSDASAIFERDIENHEIVSSAHEAVEIAIPPALDDAAEAFTSDDPSDIEIVTASSLRSQGFNYQEVSSSLSSALNPWTGTTITSIPSSLPNSLPNSPRHTIILPASAGLPPSSPPISPRSSELSNSPDKRRISFISYADMLNEEKMPSSTGMDRVASSSSLRSLGLRQSLPNTCDIPTSAISSMSLSETIKHIHGATKMQTPITNEENP